jgi:hypothetical protein
MGTVESIFKAPADNYITGVVTNTDYDGEYVKGYLTSPLKNITQYNFVPSKLNATIMGIEDNKIGNMNPDNSHIIKFAPGYFLINITKDIKHVGENVVSSFTYITQNESGQIKKVSPVGSSMPLDEHSPEIMSYKSACKTYITELTDTMVLGKKTKNTFLTVCPEAKGPDAIFMLLGFIFLIFISVVLYNQYTSNKPIQQTNVSVPIPGV